MARGRPPKRDILETAKNDIKTVREKYTCFYCGYEYLDKNYYKSNSVFYNNIGSTIVKLKI